MESYTKWEPVAGVVSPCGYIVLHADPLAHTVLLRFSTLRDAPPRDLLLRFGRQVVACMSHDEFVHPWQAHAPISEVPRLDGWWAPYAFPLLKVRQSRWLASFADTQILEQQREELTHYRFVSLDNTVDLLASGAVTAEWVPAGA